MGNTIEVYDDITASTPRDTITGNTITLTFDASGDPTYNPPTAPAYDVAYLVANVDHAGAVINTTGSSLSVNAIRATANGAGVASLLDWEYSPTTGSVSKLNFSSPSTSGDQMEWEFGVGVPTIRLKVKIKRR